MKKEVKYIPKQEEWLDAKTKAYNKLNNKYKIDGFRQGKAPRNIFEKKYASDITIEAANILIDKKYKELILDKKNPPILEPKVNIQKIEEDGLEATFTIITEPEVKLGKYKDLKVKKPTVKVTKEEIDTKIQNLLKEYAELVVKEDGKVEKGDIAVIDFEGFKDGVAFDGGKGTNYSLEIGSNSFIPGFEDGIIGMKKGQTKELNLTFPKDYGMEDLKGKDVVFKVTVNEIKNKVIPKLDKDFFADLGMDDVNSKKELETKIKEEITEEKEKNAEHNYVNELLEKAVANMTCEIDDEIVIQEATNMYNDMLNQMSMQGITEEVYLKYTNSTKESIIETMKADALKRLKNSYLLNAIVKEEKIKVTQKEVEKEIKDIAQKHNLTKEEVVEAIGGTNNLMYDLEFRKAIDILKGETKESK